MQVRLFYLTLRSDAPIPHRPERVRGYLATQFNEYSLLHQHIEGDRFRYRYPLVQYRVLDNAAVVIGINEGADVLKEIYRETDSLRLGSERYRIVERSIGVEDAPFGLATEIVSYRFVTPWIALNQKNYTDFAILSETDRHDRLRGILVGNILSASKGLEYQVPDQIRLEIGPMTTRTCSLKGIPVIGFMGSFTTNFTIPDLLGLGKSVSRGYGAVRQLR
ncbi:MAG: CRISPR-associated endonuclease Cas6, partial [Methanospirillum sp.]